VLAPGFYARQDVRTPVKIAVAVLVLTQLLNLVFVRYLALGHAGLALSIGLAALVNATWLFIGLRRAGSYTPLPGWGLFALRVVAATALLGGLLWWSAHTIDWLALRDHPWQRIGWLVASLVGAAVLYFGALVVSGLKLRQFMRHS